MKDITVYCPECGCDEYMSGFDNIPDDHRVCDFCGQEYFSTINYTVSFNDSLKTEKGKTRILCYENKIMEEFLEVSIKENLELDQTIGMLQAEIDTVKHVNQEVSKRIVVQDYMVESLKADVICLKHDKAVLTEDLRIIEEKIIQRENEVDRLKVLLKIVDRVGD
jgi:FtsZ-binding cell division protein ZapB